MTNILKLDLNCTRENIPVQIQKFLIKNEKFSNMYINKIIYTCLYMNGSTGNIQEWINIIKNKNFDKPVGTISGLKVFIDYNIDIDTIRFE